MNLLQVHAFQNLIANNTLDQHPLIHFDHTHLPHQYYLIVNFFPQVKKIQKQKHDKKKKVKNCCKLSQT